MVTQNDNSARGVADLGNGWIQYYCQFCGHGPFSAMKDSLAGRLQACPQCLRRASASETLKRLKPIDDPVISDALRDVGESRI